MSKALQEFDLALRGKKKREKFLKDGRKKKELTAEDRAEFEILKAQMFAERAAKRDRRPKRARAMPDDEATPAAANQKAGKANRKSVFDEELTNTSSKALKQYRAGPSFADRKRLGLNKKRQGSDRKRQGSDRKRQGSDRKQHGTSRFKRK
ncbi:hypothetical protein LDENG_00238580 [Lucifuga dentata]|nr:hypothetical protein LDENG_00238580 [Lucifuga dentata]